MMHRFYSRLRSLRHLRVLVAILIGASLGMACGSPAVPPAEPETPASIRSLIEQAQDAERQRDYHLARKLYTQAIAEAPDPPARAIANREMASALAFWGEYEGALEKLEASAALDPSQPRVWHDLGIIQDHLGYTSDALRSMHRAVALRPKEPRSRVALAALLVKDKQYREAISEYETLLELPIPERIEKATREALRILREEIRRSP